MGKCFSHSDRPHDKRLNNQTHKLFKTSDFQFVKLIGKGGFSKVWKVIQKKSKNIYAIKVMDKQKIIAKKSVKDVLSQRKILSHLSKAKINFIANIQGSFQDKTKLYLLMDYLQGNTLRHHLNCGVILSEAQIRLIVIALVKIFQQLYNHRIIHGDLKPENILFDKEGVPFLTDFGSASYYKLDNSDFNSGTLGYMAPEVMLCQCHNYAADYYAIGVIAFQLLMRKRPYPNLSRQLLLKQIKKKPVNLNNFPELNVIDPQAQDFIMRLLQRRPINRLGYMNGIAQLVSHPWLSLDLNQIDILKELNNINTILQSQEKSPTELTEQSDSIDEKKERMNKFKLDSNYIQQMFEGFDTIVALQVNPERRGSTCEMVERIQSTHNIRKLSQS